jgi:hypothetical protein
VNELERELLALGDEIAWPPTPDLAAAVGARIATEPRRPAGRAWRWPWQLERPRLATALAAMLVVLIAFGVLLASSPGVRATLRDWLGIGSVRITRVERLPDLAPARELGLGKRVTMARAEADFGTIATVRALGAPDAIYLGEGLPHRVSLVYIARPGLPAGKAGIGALLDEIQGDTPLVYAEKLVGARVPITHVKVNGDDGYFIGGSHALQLPDELRPRLAGNTLVWQHDAVTYRLETALGLRQALALARSVD